MLDHVEKGRIAKLGGEIVMVKMRTLDAADPVLAKGMARDLAEARRLFAAMGATGWEAYARSIEE